MEGLLHAVSALFGLRRGWLLDARLLALLVAPLLVLSTDTPVMLTLLYALSAIFVIVAVAHVIRRILFHYVDLELVFDRATESPTGAGLAFLSLCLLIASIVLSAAIWIAR